MLCQWFSRCWVQIYFEWSTTRVAGAFYKLVCRCSILLLYAITNTSWNTAEHYWHGWKDFFYMKPVIMRHKSRILMILDPLMTWTVSSFFNPRSVLHTLLHYWQRVSVKCMPSAPSCLVVAQSKLCLHSVLQQKCTKNPSLFYAYFNVRWFSNNCSLLIPFILTCVNGINAFL